MTQGCQLLSMCPVRSLPLSILPVACSRPRSCPVLSFLVWQLSTLAAASKRLQLAPPAMTAKVNGQRSSHHSYLSNNSSVSSDEKKST